MVQKSKAAGGAMPSAVETGWVYFVALAILLSGDQSNFGGGKRYYTYSLSMYAGFQTPSRRTLIFLRLQFVQPFLDLV